MLARLYLAACFLLGIFGSPALAQSPQVLPSCGTASIPVGTGGRLFTDQTGNLCTTGGGAGGSSQAGSVTPGGTPGSEAQAVQGIENGVPQRVVPQDNWVPAGYPLTITASRAPAC